MVTVNCSAIVPTLFESELFGHVRGAFTGATDQKAGLFEYAHGGTLFFDEIGELPLSVQAKLLRALETGEVQRVGAVADRKVDVLVLAATNRDLRAEVDAGRFRNDLVPMKVSYAFTSLASLQGLIQYNRQSSTISSNIRLALLDRSGTGLFAVYNERRDTADITSDALLGRSFIVKYTRLVDF